jgi:formate dehydrogenase major subunit
LTFARSADIFDSLPIAVLGDASKLTRVSRRDFLKVSAAGAGAAGLSALGFDVAQAATIKQDLHIDVKQKFNTVCPYCAVGCALIAYTKGTGAQRQIVQIEGNPDSPINEGRLCPKGASAMQLAVSDRRVPNVMYRAPKATSWQSKTWDQALDMIAQRIKDARDATFVATDANGLTVNRTEGMAFAGGAAFSSEEGYFTTKVMRTLGVVHLEQQARV